MNKKYHVFDEDKPFTLQEEVENDREFSSCELGNRSEIFRAFLKVENNEDIFSVADVDDTGSDFEDFVKEVLYLKDSRDDFYYPNEFLNHFKDSGMISNMAPYLEICGMVYFFHETEDGIRYIRGTDGSVIRIFYIGRDTAEKYAYLKDESIIDMEEK